MPWIVLIVMNVVALKVVRVIMIQMFILMPRIVLIMMHVRSLMTMVRIEKLVCWMTFWIVISLMMRVSRSMLMDM